MIIKLKPHPNYLKVIHSYIWLTFFVYIIIVLSQINSTFLAVSAVVIGLIIPFFVLKWVFSLFIKRELVLNVSEIETVAFHSFFLEKAYGVGTLSINNKKEKGIHIDDFQKIIRNMES